LRGQDGSNRGLAARALAGISKNHGIAWEQPWNCRGNFSRQAFPVGFVLKTPGFMPRLLLPWNIPAHHGERAFLRLVHTMKKMIL
jgi:hypothetical protein